MGTCGLKLLWVGRGGCFEAGVKIVIHCFIAHLWLANVISTVTGERHRFSLSLSVSFREPHSSRGVPSLTDCYQKIKTFFNSNRVSFWVDIISTRGHETISLVKYFKFLLMNIKFGESSQKWAINLNSANSRSVQILGKSIFVTVLSLLKMDQLF